MSTSDYTTDLKTLKTALNQLNHEELDLSSAMQMYKKGVQHHERCVNTLAKLEQSLENNESECIVDVDVDVEPVELTLEDVFSSLESIEHSIEDLPETHLESCVELLVQAERLLHAGYRQIDLATDTLGGSLGQSADSTTLSKTDEVHRV